MPAPDPEARAAAARRVAHDLAYRNGVCTAQARETFMCHGTICQEAAAALLAFPGGATLRERPARGPREYHDGPAGGDAEPVAWRHANGHVTDNKGEDIGLVEAWRKRGDDVTPLYAAPVARGHDPLCLGCVACSPAAPPPEESPHA